MPRRHIPTKHRPFTQPSSCESKRRFRNEAEALQALELQELQRNVELATYQCPQCAGWHLTSVKSTTS